MIVVVGLSHRTAPIEVRERLVLPAEVVPELLRGLVDQGTVGEALLMSTCNRVEIVVAGVDGQRADFSVLAEKARQTVLGRAPDVASHLYEHVGRDAVRHLFRVAASLDSLVLGEPQILGQLKDAYDLARDAGTVGPVLNRVVPRAIRSAKRVRSETSIGAGQVSVPSVAVDLARQIFGDLSRHRAALIGSGDMGEAVARLLRQAGAPLSVLGRNEVRVRELAQAMGGEPRSLDALALTLTQADVVVTTTSAPGFVVESSLVQQVRRARKGRSLFFIDLAVPRDVDPGVSAFDGVFLYNIDDLSGVVAQSLDNRRREAQQAEAIVEEEAASYDRWAEAEHATPTIVAFRERLRGILAAEVDRSLSGKLRHLGDADRQALLVMVEASLNKLLHPMALRLRRLAGDPEARAELGQATAILRELFDLVPQAQGDESQDGQDGRDGEKEEDGPEGGPASGRAREAS